MKVQRLLFIAVFVLLATNMYSQFAPSVKINSEIAVDGSKNFCFGAQGVFGYKITPQILLGAGTGISYTNLLFEPAHYISSIRYYHKDYKETGAYVPLFATAKINFLKKGISPYFSIDGGYSFLIPFSEYARKYVSLGAFVSPHFGVDFPLPKGSIGVEIGYKYQVMKNTTLVNEKLNYNQVTIAVGYNF